MLERIISNWKTTLLGLGALLTGAGAVLTGLATGDFGGAQEGFLAASAAVGGLGLLFARD